MILCTEAMLRETLREALSTTDEVLRVPPDKLPRVMVLSGMTGARVRALLIDLVNEHRAMSVKK